MNIILITEFFPESSTDITGGIESRAYNVAKELAKKHTVYVLTSYKGKKRQYKLEGINVLRVGKIPLHSNRPSHSKNVV